MEFLQLCQFLQLCRKRPAETVVHTWRNMMGIEEVSDKIHFVIDSCKNLLRSNKVKLVRKPSSAGRFPVNELPNKFNDSEQT
jgi:hypothetical protein